MSRTNKTKLELTWIGKDKRPKLEPRILLEDSTKSYHASHKVTENDIFDNKLIFGDNLLALKALEQNHAGKIKCVFIDPPYNTGNAFKDYDDGVEHSIWLSLIRERLIVLKNLLCAEGSIWVTIDDNEMAYLKVIMDEIFGRNNFVSTIIWEKDAGRKNDTTISTSHDYILVYAINASSWKAVRNPLERGEEQLKRFKNPDNDHRGPWRQGADGTAKSGNESLRYEITLPSGKILVPPTGNYWRFSRKTFDLALKEDRVYFGKKGDSSPVIKTYLSELKGGMVPKTWWPSSEVGSNQSARRDHLRKLLPNIEPFATPKPEQLLERIIHIATNEGDLVLDSFAGSGTTGSVAHKMKRNWILIELEETCHTHIVPRLKKVVDGEDEWGSTKSTNWEGGGGFRYFRLAPSLLEQDRWGRWVISNDYDSAMLAEAICKLEGFTYSPSESEWWNHGYSTEQDRIYVTTQTLSTEQLQALSEEVGEDQSVLVCCSAFRCKADRFPNLTLKKIPKMVLSRCEYGHDDYSLNIENLPMQEKPEEEPMQAGLFDDNGQG